MKKQVDAPKAKLTKAQQELVDVDDRIVFATLFTTAGVALAPVCFLAGTEGTRLAYVASALLLVVSLLGSIRLWRLWQRRKELLRRGVKEPDFGKPPELKGIERLLRPGGE